MQRVHLRGKRLFRVISYGQQGRRLRLAGSGRATMSHKVLGCIAEICQSVSFGGRPETAVTRHADEIARRLMSLMDGLLLFGDGCPVFVVEAGNSPNGSKRLCGTGFCQSFFLYCHTACMQPLVSCRTRLGQTELVGKCDVLGQDVDAGHRDHEVCTRR